MLDRRHVWVRWAGDLHEQAVDLYVCERYFVKEFYGMIGDDGEVFYRTPDNKWIKQTDFIDPPEYKDEPVEQNRHIRGCDPREVVRSMVSNDYFGGKLPDCLAEYRKYGDPDAYYSWAKSNRESENGYSFSPREAIPLWENRTLYFDSHACKVYKKDSPVQFPILQAFQDKSWPR